MNTAPDRSHGGNGRSHEGARDGPRRSLIGSPVAIVLLAASILLATPLFLMDRAEALTCPRGYNARGLNCCKVVRGRASCARNPRLPNALAPLMADDRFIGRPIVIDGSDLTEEALASVPGYRPRPLSTEARVLRPDDDVCDTGSCRFDTIRALAEDRRDQPGCVPTLREHYCRHSMWRDLDLEQRFARILVLGREFAEEYDVDVRAFPCIAAIETRFLEPLTVSELSCQGVASDQGLPQIIRPTFHLLYNTVGFRSRVADYGDRGGPEHLRGLFSAIGQSVRHQLELMAVVLANSGLNDSRSNYMHAFINYNGGRYSIGYGYQVEACLTCLWDRVDITTMEMRGDPIRCLNAAAGGADLRRAFAEFRSTCE